MAQRVALVDELKRALKERSLTYADVARHLEISEASIKRLFSTADFSLERLDSICELLNLELAELIERMSERKAPTTRLSLAQEREILSDPRLFLMTWLVLNHWRLEEIVGRFRFSEREVEAYLIKLDRLKLIELQPGNRARLRVARVISWHPNGPIHRFLHEKVLKEFLSDEFAEPRGEFHFYGAMLSDGTIARIKRSIQRLLKECEELAESDRSLPLTERNGVGYVFALRPWKYTGFEAFKKQ